MDCYFLSIVPSPNLSDTPGVPSCLRTGRVGGVGLTWAEITSTQGISATVPYGPGRRLRVLGIKGAASCAGRPFASLFTSGARPDVYVLADRTMNILIPGAITLAGNYSAGRSPNLGLCETTPAVVSASPSSGNHRGGVAVSLGVNGVASGATVLIGDAPCTDVLRASSTTVTCLSSAQAPSAAALTLTVTNPNGPPGALATGYRPDLYVYVAKASGLYEIKLLTVTLSTRKLNYVSMVSGAGSISHLELHPSGKFLYYSMPTVGLVGVRPIDPVGGAIGVADESFSNATSGYDSLRMSPDGKFLFIGSNTTDKVYVAAVNQTNGSLSSVTSETLGGNIPKSIAISPDGTYLYVAPANDAVRGFRVRADGTLQVISGIGLSYISLAAFASVLGSHLVVFDADSTKLRSYSIRSSGLLDAISVVSMSASKRQIRALGPGRRTLYILGSVATSVESLPIGTDGSLGTLSSYSPILFGGQGRMDGDPDAGLIAFSDDNSPLADVRLFHTNDDGTLVTVFDDTLDLDGNGATVWGAVDLAFD